MYIHDIYTCDYSNTESLCTENVIMNYIIHISYTCHYG